MLGFELLCLAIVAVWVALRLRREPDRPALLRRLALLAAASWVAEDSVIHAYGFYDYGGGWSVVADRMPVLVALIWPVVIQSAADLASGLGLSGRVRVLVAAAIVLADASLIEPVAVQAGLWAWTQPGLFLVPPIGIVGWALFAAWALWLLDTPRIAGRGAQRALLVLVLPALLTHGCLLALWWGALRWLSGPVPPWPAVVAVWGVSALVTLRARTAAAPARLSRADLLVGAPAALVFFLLLLLHGRDEPALVAWAVAFAPPYLVLTWRARP